MQEAACFWQQTTVGTHEFCSTGKSSRTLKQSLKLLYRVITNDTSIETQTRLNKHAPEQVILYSTAAFEIQVLQLVVALNLPFRAINNIQLRYAFIMLQPYDINIPFAGRVRQLLDKRVDEVEETTLDDLPPTAKISLALNTWTSPNNLAFMAVTRYYIDENWQYREALLGFEPLTGTHSGPNLAVILRRVLEKHDILDRVFALTTDNASNNTTLAKSLEELLTDWQSDMMHIPCLAHVIQLVANSLLCNIGVTPINDNLQNQWNNKADEQLIQKEKGFGCTLEKVSLLSFNNSFNFS